MTEQPAETQKEKEIEIEMETRELKEKSAEEKPIKAKNKVGLVLVILGLLAGLGGGAYWWYNRRPTTNEAKSTAVAAGEFKPFFNPAYGRKVVVAAQEETVGYVVDEAGTVITVTFPKGAVETKTEITLVPYGGGKSDGAFGAGVMIAPNQVFNKPITIGYLFGQSKVLVGAGQWRAFTYDEKTYKQEPAMILASGTNAHLATVRTITGGAVFVGTDKAAALERAKQVLAKPKLSLFTLLAAARELTEQNELPTGARERIGGAVKKYMNSEEPTLPELYTAVMVDRALTKSQSKTLVGRVYAQGADMSGYLEMRCKDRNLTVIEYLSAAQTAQLIGRDEIAEGCLDLVREKLDEEARKVLANPRATVKEVLIVLQKALAFGVEKELTDKLWEKAKGIVKQEADQFVKKSGTTDIEAAKVLQKMQALGVEGEARATLETRIQNRVQEADDRATERGNSVKETFDLDDQAYLPNFDMTIIGLAMAKASGLESFDEEGLKDWADKLVKQGEELKLLGQASCEAIAIFAANGFDPNDIARDLGGELPPWQQECAKVEAGGEVDRLIRELEDEGYELAEDVGEMQELYYEQYEEDAPGTIESEYENGVGIPNDDQPDEEESLVTEEGNSGEERETETVGDWQGSGEDILEE